MDTNDRDWLDEIERRAAVYDTPADDSAGRLSGIDYLGMTVLTVALSALFWIWAV